MIEDWYFCSCIGATPLQAQSFLDQLEGLEIADPDSSLLLVALRQLGGMEAAMRRYALPRVVDIGWRAGTRAPALLVAARQEVAHALDGLDQAIRGPLSHATEALFNHEPGEVILGHLASATHRARARSLPAATNQPYLDTEDFTAEVLLLTIAAQLLRQVPGLTETVTEQNEVVDLVRRALDGRFGRLPLLLAARIAGFAGSQLVDPDALSDSLLNPVVGSVAYEPDLLAAYARFCFGSAGSRGQDVPVADVLPSIRSEIVGLELVNRLRPRGAQREQDRAAIARLGLEGGPTNVVTSVLWQSVLWQLAATVDPRGTAEMVSECWIPPHKGITKKVMASAEVTGLDRWRRDLDSLARLRLVGGSQPVEFQLSRGEARISTFLSVAVLTPWVDRVPPDPRRHHSTNFPRARDGLVLWRLLTAVCTASTLARHCADAPVAQRQLVTLLTHGADVLQDDSYRSAVQQLTKVRRPTEESERVIREALSVPLAGLVLYTTRVLERLGGGKIKEVEPRWFAEFATTDESRSAPEQEARLRGAPALRIAEVWANNALSATIPSETYHLDGRWRAPIGEPGSPSVAEWVFQSAKGSAALKAAGLQVAYLDPRSSGLDLPRWHGTKSIEQLKKNIWWVIGGQKPTVEDWLALPESLKTAEPVVARALATERLIALFRASGGIDPKVAESWLEEWRNLHQQVRGTVDLARAERLRVLELLGCAIEGTPSERMVLEDVLDLELEFGMGTPVDRWMLFKHLSESSDLPLQLAQLLRIRLLRGIYYRQSSSGTPEVGRSPWAALAGDESNALLDRMLQRFIVSIGDTPAEIAGYSRLREAVPDLWLDANSCAQLVAEEAALTGRETRLPVDRRRLVGVTIDHVRDVLQFQLLREPLGTIGNAELVDPLAVSPSDMLAKLTQQPIQVLGSVCAIEGERFWVNCGLGEPVEGEAPLSYQPSIGDSVSIPLVRAAKPAYRSHGVVNPSEGRPELDDIRRARVSSRERDGHQEIRVEVASAHEAEPRVPVAVNDSTMFRRWDPDVLRSLEGVPLAPTETFARWDGENWMPVDWAVAEFLAVDAAAATGDDPLRLTMIDDLQDKGAIRCATRPGRLFVLPNSLWHPDALVALRAAVGAGDVLGVSVLAKVVSDEDGQPLLELVPDLQVSPEDRIVNCRNLRWRELFDDSEELLAYREDGRWLCYPVDPDFPPIIVNLRSPDAVTAFTSSNWNDTNQRAGRVDGLTVTLHEMKVDRNDVAEFYRLFNLKPGDQLELNRVVAAPSWGLVNGYTSEGLPVEVEGESVTLGPISRRLDNAFVVDRPLQVVYERARPHSGWAAECAPLPTGEFVQSVDEDDRERVEDALIRSSALRGLVIAVPRQKSNSGLDRSTVWLEAQGTVFTVSLPHSAFDRVPLVVGALIKARLTPDGWIFTAQSRKLRVRASWILDERGEPASSDFVLGEVQWQGTTRTLIQARRAPRLYLRPPGAVAGDHLAPVRGGRPEFDLSKARVETSKIIADNYQRIMLRSGDAFCCGETRQHNPTDRARATAVSIRVDQVRPGRVIVRRVFTLNDARGSERAAPETDRDPLIGYHNYLAGERAPLEATLEGSSARIDARWRVPVGGRLSQLVPLADEERPWVDAGTKFDRSAWVILVGDENDQRASYRGVPPVRLDRFVHLFEQQGLVVGIRSKLRTNLYYVDRRQTPRGVMHRFEWGYGKTLEVADDDLSMDGALLAERSSALFHGDTIQHVEVRFTGGRYRLNLAHRDIRWGWYSWVYHEASLGVIHLADLDRGRAGERPRIKRVHTRTKDRWSDQSGHRAAMTIPLSRAHLSKPAADAISEILREQRGNDTPMALVVLDRERFQASGGTEVFFDYMPPDQLPVDARVFMRAVNMRPLPNDVQLVLHLDRVLGAEPDRPVKAHVSKRDFSYRSQLLQDIYLADRSSQSESRQLRGSVYLVRLKENRRGIIRDALARPPAALTSYLRNSGTRCLAVVSQVTDSRIDLEVEPNVTFRLDRKRTSGTEGLPKGSVVRLALDEDRVVFQTALIGESAYLPAGGRSAVLLPMQSVTSRRKTFDEAMKAGAYAVAGLSSLTVRAVADTRRPSDFERGLLTMAHPRVCRVEPSGRGLRLMPPGPSANAGYVRFADDGSATIVPAAGDPAFPARLAQLTFQDGSAVVIRRRCEQNGWTYHDLTTAHRDPAMPDNVLPDVDLPRPARIDQEPVFFSPGWTLRHRPERLPEIGFPATDLIESMARGSRGKKRARLRTLPIAGTATLGEGIEGVWVEQAPGRIAHLSETMLSIRAGDRFIPAEGLAWDHVAPGDMITLAVEPATATEIPSVELRGWKPGPRGAFGARVLLPVTDADLEAGRLTLGVGIWSLDYPLGPGEEAPTGAVWLDRDNHLVQASAEPEVQAGSVVLLSEDDEHELRIVGAPQLRPELADVGVAHWLRNSLADAGERARLFALCGGALPVTVEEVSSVGDQVVRVSRRKQRDFALKAGEQIPVQPLGELTRGRVLLRRGGKLCVCRTRDLIPGAPASVLGAVFERLVSQPDLLWSHVPIDGQYLTIGLAPVGATLSEQSEIQVRPLAVLGEGGDLGLLCWDSGHARPRWLPAGAVGWAELDTQGLTDHVIAGQRDLTVQIMPDGSVSIVDRAVNRQRRELLRAGARLRLIVCSTEPRDAAPGRVRYAARIYPSDVLVEFEQKADQVPPALGDIRMCEVDRIYRDTTTAVIIAVDPWAREIMLDLPRWITEKTDPTAAIAATALSQQGAHASLAGLLEQARRVDEVSQDARAQMARWLTDHGADALHQLDIASLDAVPMIAAVLVLDWMGQVDGHWSEDSAELSVRLCHHLGLRAARARHVEPIVTRWLMDRSMAELDALWQRLNWMTIDSKITLETLERNRGIDRGIRARMAVRASSPLTAVSGGVSAAAGVVEKFDEIDQHGDDFRLLAGLGRALTPHPHGIAAQCALLAAQRRVLWDLWARLSNRPPMFFDDDVVALLGRTFHDEAALRRTVDSLLANPIAGTESRLTDDPGDRVEDAAGH